MYRLFVVTLMFIILVFFLLFFLFIWGIKLLMELSLVYHAMSSSTNKNARTHQVVRPGLREIESYSLVEEGKVI